MDTQVTVHQGILQGKQCVTYYGKKYYSFEGIPYAKPPVGKLRFRNPEPADPWNGVLDATKPGNKCIQSNPYSATSAEGSEDCLYLNIYTPSLPREKKEKLPVFFFVHGGRLIFGYGNYYTPDYLIKHDVILVTMNYRLHVLGWLCLNLPECPGNMGLKDTVLALKWVKQNIDSFNGDVSNVTVAGESAGAAIVTSYLTSEMTEGLYNKVICTSGNCIADLFIIVDEDQIEKGKYLCSLLGKELTDPKEMYEFLSEAPVEDLLLAFGTAEISRPPAILNSYFTPVVEKKFEGVDQFFAENPRLSILNNKFYKVPIICTSNAYESVVFFGDEEGNLKVVEDFSYLLPRYARIDDTRKETVTQMIREFYLKNKSKIEYATMLSDAYFVRDIMLFPEIISKFWDQIYVLKFNYFGNLHTRVMKRMGIKGATHGDMIQYQFYRKNKAKNCTERDQEIVDFLNESFCTFMKNGYPTWRNQKTKWLPYTNEQKRTLLVEDDISLQTNLDRDRLLFWIRILKEHCKL